MQQVIKGLDPILRGWMAYFRLTEEKNVLEELDGWLRHKLRILLWRQWKRVYTRARNPIKAGIGEVRAWKSATNDPEDQVGIGVPLDWFGFTVALVEIVEHGLL